MSQEWAHIETELRKPLERSHVKGRTQAGRTLSYIEGWHAIAEANRIFGFDAWTRETIEIRCVCEKPREIGKDNYKKPGFGVSYLAKVRVTVHGVTREGFGAGHGIDADLGLAHESASKEAETDAMKRALMTFGNPFGLALYDKQQANVVDSDISTPIDRPEDSDFAGVGGNPGISISKIAREFYAQCSAEIRTHTTAPGLKKWGETRKPEIQLKLTPGYVGHLEQEYLEQMHDIKSGKFKNGAPA